MHHDALMQSDWMPRTTCRNSSFVIIDAFPVDAMGQDFIAQIFIRLPKLIVWYVPICRKIWALLLNFRFPSMAYGPFCCCDKIERSWLLLLRHWRGATLLAHFRREIPLLNRPDGGAEEPWAIFYMKPLFRDSRLWNGSIQWPVKQQSTCVSYNPSSERKLKHMCRKKGGIFEFWGNGFRNIKTGISFLQRLNFEPSEIWTGRSCHVRFSLAALRIAKSSVDRLEPILPPCFCLNDPFQLWVIIPKPQ